MPDVHLVWQPQRWRLNVRHHQELISILCISVFIGEHNQDCITSSYSWRANESLQLHLAKYFLIKWYISTWSLLLELYLDSPLCLSDNFRICTPENIFISEWVASGNYKQQLNKGWIKLKTAFYIFVSSLYVRSFPIYQLVVGQCSMCCSELLKSSLFFFFFCLDLVETAAISCSSCFMHHSSSMYLNIFHYLSFSHTCRMSGKLRHAAWYQTNDLPCSDYFECFSCTNAW